MSALDKVIEWITASEANAVRFREDFSVVHQIADSLNAVDVSVLKKIHAQGLAASVAPTSEVMGMRSYGWADKTDGSDID